MKTILAALFAAFLGLTIAAGCGHPCKDLANNMQKKCPAGFGDKDKFIKGCKKDLSKDAAKKCSKLDSCSKIMGCIGKAMSKKKK